LENIARKLVQIHKMPEGKTKSATTKAQTETTTRNAKPQNTTRLSEARVTSRGEVPSKDALQDDLCRNAAFILLLSCETDQRGSNMQNELRNKLTMFSALEGSAPKPWT
jgi:hypothetical protein